VSRHVRPTQRQLVQERGRRIGLSVAIPPELVEEIAQRAAAIALERLREDAGSPPRLLTVSEAAELLRAKPRRVYDLLSDGRLTRRKDGRRVLVDRQELEWYIAGSRSGRNL
jgi:excisionase family DNA binding protein